MEHPLDNMPDDMHRLINEGVELNKRLMAAFPEGMIRGIGGGKFGKNPGKMNIFFNEGFDTPENRAMVENIARSHGIELTW